jgi:hypothetical protein
VVAKEATPMNQPEEIKSNDQLIAIIPYNEFRKDGMELFTPSEFSHFYKS